LNIILERGGAKKYSLILMCYGTQSNDDCGVWALRKEENLKYHA